jgi:hypothetical protein
VVKVNIKKLNVKYFGRGGVASRFVVSFHIQQQYDITTLRYSQHQNLVVYFVFVCVSAEKGARPVQTVQIIYITSNGVPTVVAK